MSNVTNMVKIESERLENGRKMAKVLVLAFLPFKFFATLSILVVFSNRIKV